MKFGLASQQNRDLVAMRPEWFLLTRPTVAVRGSILRIVVHVNPGSYCLFVPTDVFIPVVDCSSEVRLK